MTNPKPTTRTSCEPLEVHPEYLAALHRENGHLHTQNRDLARELEVVKGELAVADIAARGDDPGLENRVRQEVRRRTNQTRRDLGKAGDTIHRLRGELALAREKRGASEVVNIVNYAGAPSLEELEHLDRTGRSPHWAQ